MSNDSLPATQPLITNQSEIYNRGNNGQLSPRVGVISDLLNIINPQTVINIQVNNISVDLTDITKKLDFLPIELGKRDLNVKYNEIKKCLENYLTYKKKGILEELMNKCQNYSPLFDQIIKEQSGNINTNNSSFKNDLAYFEAICDAYVTVLGIYLFSVVILYPESVEKESAINGHLIEIDESLRALIRRSLIPNRIHISETLLAESFLNKDNNQFNKYFLYSGYQNNPDGVKKLLIDCNGQKRYHEGIHIDTPSNYRKSYDSMLANKAIELLENFNEVHNARINYKYNERTNIQETSP